MSLDYRLKLERRKCEESLHHFFKSAWPWMEGNTPFIDNWHIKAICEHLEAIYNRDIRKLLINVPPRTGKSGLVSCAFPAWVWIHDPEEKFLCASYGQSLSSEHSLKCRRLIESSWYQDFWPYVALAKDQNAKGYFQNDMGGYRISSSVGGANTGKGASILLLDDGNSADEGFSDAKREATNTWRDQVWSTRLNNPKEDCEIVIQQRLHSQDISGVILDRDETNEWTKLILPNEFDEKRKCRTVINGKVWEDPRTKQGELLCEARIGKKETANLKRQLGSYGYAGQYLMVPSPPDGAIFKKSWFKWWKHQELPEFDGRIMSFDTAYTTKATSDYSACTTWGLFTDQHKRMNVMLLSWWRGKLTYEDLRKMAKNLYFDYRHRTLERDPRLKGKKIDICLVEATGFGDQLLYDFNQAGISAIPFVPNKYGDKTLRAQLVAPIVESGLIWLQAQKPSFTELTMESQEFLEFAAKFPKADSRDVIDTMTQAFIYLKQGVTLKLSQDEEDEPRRSTSRPPPPVY